MKHIFLISSLIVGLFVGAIAPSPVSAADDSLKTLSRLLVYNSEGKTLLIKVSAGFWVTPAVHNKDTDTLRPALDKLAGEYGLQISAPELMGIVSLKYDFPTNQSLYNRVFYRVEATGGAVRLPEDIVDYKWVSEAEALQMLSFAHISIPYAQMIAEPERVWAGSFRFYLEDGERKSDQLGPLYPIK